ncbi:hypothetical protein MKX03_006870 [Papaver bracteatum]|nr:hypothetical protein MKX03_006870 [Papaver bracteatum]
MPRTLPLIVVQRHAAASKSVSPLSNTQQLLDGGAPNTKLTSPPSTSPQIPNFREFLLGPLGGETLGWHVGGTLGLHDGSQANVLEKVAER